MKKTLSGFMAFVILFCQVETAFAGRKDNAFRKDQKQAQKVQNARALKAEKEERRWVNSQRASRQVEPPSLSSSSSERVSAPNVPHVSRENTRSSRSSGNSKSNVSPLTYAFITTLLLANATCVRADHRSDVANGVGKLVGDLFGSFGWDLIPSEETLLVPSVVPRQASSPSMNLTFANATLNEAQPVSRSNVTAASAAKASPTLAPVANMSIVSAPTMNASTVVSLEKANNFSSTIRVERSSSPIAQANKSALVPVAMAKPRFDLVTEEYSNKNSTPVIENQLRLPSASTPELSANASTPESRLVPVAEPIDHLENLSKSLVVRPRIRSENAHSLLSLLRYPAIAAVLLAFLKGKNRNSSVTEAELAEARKEVQKITKTLKDGDRLVESEKLKDELATARGEIENLKKEKESIETSAVNELVGLENRIENLRNYYADLFTKNGKLDGELRALRDENNTLEEKLHALEKTLSKKENQLNDLQDKLIVTRSLNQHETKRSKEQVQQLEEQVRSLQALQVLAEAATHHPTQSQNKEITELRQNLEKALAEVKEKHKEIQTLQIENNLLEAEKGLVEIDHAAIASKHAELEKTHEAQKVSLAREQTFRAAAEAQASLHEETSKNLEKQVKDLTEKLEKLNQGYALSQKAMQVMKEQFLNSGSDSESESDSKS